jgi:phosphoribosylaminoimidazolecarboxamide formyltransferase/IMP cyclohydrolase
VVALPDACTGEAAIFHAGVEVLSLCALRTGGWLYQEADSLAAEDVAFTPVSEAQATPEQLEDLKFAWRLVKHVKSNAITVAKRGRLLGMGSGQPNRVKSVDIALEKAGAEAQVGVRSLVLTN